MSLKVYQKRYLENACHINDIDSTTVKQYHKNGKEKYINVQWSGF